MNTTDERLPAVRDIDPTGSDLCAAWAFFRHLKASRLMDPADVAAMERQARTTPLAVLQQLLLDAGHLTAYQLDRVAAGTPDGLVLGRYRVLGELGRGGFGQVFKARHTLMDRVVALKVLNPDLCQDWGTRAVFLREVVTTTRLSHPNIAAAYDADEVDGRAFLVVEYVDGRSLEGRIRAGGPVSVPEACELLTQTAHALRHAQECGLVHRDLKPANIMLAGPPDAVRVKVIDFGLASLRRPDRSPVDTLPCEAGAVVGTPSFIPPEQITDVHAADTRSDLYSLGCTLYYALTGRLPFEGKTTKLVLLRHLRHDVPDLRSYQPGVPDGLAAIVHRLMARDPADRYQTPAELIDAVAAFAAGDRAYASPSSDCPAGPSSVIPPSTDSVLTQITPVSTHTEGMARPPAVDPSPRPTVAIRPEAALGLRDLWNEWCDVVAALARGAAPGLSGGEYKALYRELLVTARMAGYGPPAGWRERLATLVEPWVSVDVLAELDEPTLANLRQNCERLTSKLWPAEAGRSRGWLATFLGGVLGFFVLGWYL